MNQEQERLAEGLEAFLVEHEADPSSPVPAALPPAYASLARALLDLARTLAPDERFAANLEAQLHAQARRVPPPIGGAGGRNVLPVRRIHHVRSIAQRHARRWPTWATIAAVLLLALLIASPSVRARMGDLLRIGAVRIGWTQPTPLPRASPTPTVLPSVLDLAGATTLAQVRQQAGYPISLPTYPPDLGAPDRVYLQQLGPQGPPGTMVVLVWLDHAHPGQVRLSLYELSNNVFFYKMAPQVVVETTVHGRRALWTTGPYVVAVQRGDQVDYAERMLVTGHALIWTDGTLTYRLETSLSLAEAVRIAESLR